LNNSVGRFNGDPSVEGRMEAFSDAIEQMLWPEKRKTDRDVMKALGLPESHALDVPGFIYRTTKTSRIRIASGYLPGGLGKLLEWGPWLNRWFPWLFSEGMVDIGPIPKGTPVNLLTNLDLDRDKTEIASVLLSLKEALKRVQGVDEAKAVDIFKEDKELIRKLLALNKCPDFVVNKGHYFGTGFHKEETALSDEDKRALIEFLKTF
jgi:hypothetical protein